jgi:trigger factor
MAPWMQKLLIGKNVGEEAEGVSEKDKDSEEKEFKPTRCKLTVKKILAPELLSDEELAKKLGVGSFSDLEAGIVSQLNQRADQELQEDLRHQVEDLLLEKYSFDLPASLLQEEKEERLKDAKERLKGQNLEEDALVNKTKELEASIEKQVERSYRLFFLVLTFSRQHRIEVSKQELDAAFTEQVMWQRRTLHPEELKSLQSRIQQQLLVQKTKDYIIDHVKRQ